MSNLTRADMCYCPKCGRMMLDHSLSSTTPWCSLSRNEAEELWRLTYNRELPIEWPKKEF